MTAKKGSAVGVVTSAAQASEKAPSKSKPKGATKSKSKKSSMSKPQAAVASIERKLFGISKERFEFFIERLARRLQRHESLVHRPVDRCKFPKATALLKVVDDRLEELEADVMAIEELAGTINDNPGLAEFLTITAPQKVKH